MVLVVSNLRGPLLVVLSYLGLIDAVLVTPKRYSLPESKQYPDLLAYPRYFETDFTSASILPSDLARLHNEFSTERDHVIAPDVRGDHEKSIDRYYEYLEHYRGDARVIFPHQALHPESRLFNLVFENQGVLGIPALDKYGSPRPLKAVQSLIREALDWGVPYHLLGFNPTRYWPRDFFLQAYSFDSQAILSYAKRFPSTFHVLQSGEWVEVDHRRTGIRALTLETRMIMFHDHLRDWLALPPSTQKKLEDFDVLREVIL